MNNYLASDFPVIGKCLPTMSLGELPTPVSIERISLESMSRDVAVKHDDLTGSPYGGNKVRKLEYVLARARDRGAKRVATFGGVGSNHAVATALYGGVAGFDCTCFLSHQSLTPGVGRALRFHQQHGTEVVRFATQRDEQIATLRKYLHGRSAWVIPLGGSSWLGSIGFVNAGLELAVQIRSGDIPTPARIYVALGTMGTAVGLALGIALAGLDIEVQAIRVTEQQVANEAAARHLIDKTAMLMRHYDSSIPADLSTRARLVCRNEFFAGGYGRSNAATEQAMEFAAEQLRLELESTYSGKAMAAMLQDLRAGYSAPVLFWNTYNSRPLDVDDNLAPDFDVMPRQFARYFD